MCGYNENYFLFAHLHITHSNSHVRNLHVNMNTFIVSARKYRPQQFDTVIGQSHITTTLKNAIRHKQLAHAFLFCGPRGVGKTTCARILAKTINCQNINEFGEACNTCVSCISFNNGSSLNIHELDAASNNSVDDIRILVEQVRFAPQAGEYKVYIIDEVHMLSTSAFNAFLKTLEEPPHYAIFILATTEKHKILPTILSRCQIFDFKRITILDTVEHLQHVATKENIQVEKPALQLIAQKSEGCMRDALSILDKIVSFSDSAVTYANTLEHLNILDHDYHFKLMESIQQQNISDALVLYDTIYHKGFEGDHVLNGLGECIRNILVCKNEKAAALLDVVEDMHPAYKKAAQQFSTSYLVSALNILNEAEVQYRMTRNKRLHVEMVLIKLCYLQQAIELSTTAEGAIVKKKRIDQPVVYRTKRIEPIPSFGVEIQHHLPSNNTKVIATKSSASNTNMVSTNTIIVEPEVNEPASIEPSTRVDILNQPKEKNLTKKTLLSSLKEKHQQQSAFAVAEAQPLNMQALQAAWKIFTQQLKDQCKPSAASNFELAVLRIVDGDSFEIISNTAIQQKFVEQERVFLLEYLQSHFNNKKLSFVLKVEAIDEQTTTTATLLSTREKFMRIAEQYPLVKELKDRLRLELEY